MCNFCLYLPGYAHDNCNYNGNLYSSNYCCNKDMRKLLSTWDNIKNTKVCLFTVLSSISWFTPEKEKEYLMESVIWQHPSHFADEVRNPRWLQLKKSWWEGARVIMLELGNGLDLCGKRRDRASRYPLLFLDKVTSSSLETHQHGEGTDLSKEIFGLLLYWYNI